MTFVMEETQGPRTRGLFLCPPWGRGPFRELFLEKHRTAEEQRRKAVIKGSAGTDSYGEVKVQVQ